MVALPLALLSVRFLFAAAWNVPEASMGGVLLIMYPCWRSNPINPLQGPRGAPYGGVRYYM